MSEVSIRKWGLSIGSSESHDLNSMIRNNPVDMEGKLERVGRGGPSRSNHAEGGNVLNTDAMPSWAEGTPQAAMGGGGIQKHKDGGFIFNVQGADPHNLKLHRATGGDVSKIDDDEGLEHYITG